jgi:hypothetical protein
MGLGETTALVAVLVIVIEGLLGLVKYLVTRGAKQDEEDKLSKISSDVTEVKDTASRLYDMHCKFDSDGTPMWYVPRTWSDTQNKIVERLEKLSHIELKMLGIIERIERRIESLPK